MASTILGWILVVLGVASYVVGLAAFLKERFFPSPGERALLPAGYSEDLKVIADLVEKVAELLEKFGKLSLPVQWAVLGLLSLGVGCYLLAAEPF